MVIEVDPNFKATLYSVLARNGTTLKDWFLASAHRFVDEQTQPSLFGTSPTGVAEAHGSYHGHQDEEGHR